MVPMLFAIFGSLAATYLFLRFLLQVTRNAREPPDLLTALPFISPILGMAGEKSKLHVRLRDHYKLPIYTLRLPFSRMYIVNATELIAPIQKQWRAISFAAIAADAGQSVGMRAEAKEIMKKDIKSQHGFSNSWPKFIYPSLSPGKDLDQLSRKAIDVFVSELDQLTEQNFTKTGLWNWTCRVMDMSTTEAVWGEKNPYRNSEVMAAWKKFESGFLTLSMFPWAAYFNPSLIKAREVVAKAMINYLKNGGLQGASTLVKKRYEHHRGFGFIDEDVARGELGNTFAVLGSTTPCALWVLYHIYRDPKLLSEIRREASELVDEKDGLSTIDLARAHKKCPILLSAFQETMRYRTVTPGARVVVEDILLDGHVLLKKGSMLMMPATVQHTNTPAWGDDASTFDYMRFVPGKDSKKVNEVAFRAFGGGHVLCPGRHFASTEILALATLLVLKFDIIPSAGEWIEPTWDNSPMHAGFPIIDEDINVEFRARDAKKKWNILFSGQDETMGFVKEDVKDGAE